MKIIDIIEDLEDILPVYYKVPQYYSSEEEKLDLDMVRAADFPIYNSNHLHCSTFYKPISRLINHEEND